MIIGNEHLALRMLRWSGSAIIVLSAAMSAILPRAPVRENVPGFVTPVVGIELASSPEHVWGILGHPTSSEYPEVARQMNLGLRLDFLYALAYPTFYLATAFLVITHGHIAPIWRVALLTLPAVMVVGDFLENRELLVLCGAREATEMTGALTRLRPITLVKWFAIYGASAILAVFIWRERGWWRWTAAFFAAAALLGISSVFHLPAIEYGLLPMTVALTMTYVRAFR